MDPTSFRLFSGAAGATESEHFSFRYPTTTRTASTADLSGNIYVVYYDYTANVDVVKYDKQGTVLWARRVNQTGTTSLYLTSIVTDGSSVYLSGGLFRSSRDYLIVVSFDSSGNLNWAKEIGNSTGAVLLAGDRNSIDLSIGKVHVGGCIYNSSTGTSQCFYARWASSTGFLEQQQSFGASSSPSLGRNTVHSIDASGTYPVLSGTNDVSGSIKPYVIRFTSAGTSATAVTVNSAAGSAFTDVKTDAGGNVYCGLGYDYARNGYVLFKFNTNLSITWQRRLGTFSSLNIKSIDVDTLTNNIYATGGSNEGNVEGGYDCLIAKWNSSGTIQWSRYFGRKNNSANETGVKIISDNFPNNLWMFNADAVSGTNVPTTGNVTANLYFPNDGSLTGDITHSGSTFEYKATNLSESAASFTASTATTSRTTESFTEGPIVNFNVSTISPSGLTVVSQP